MARTRFDRSCRPMHCHCSAVRCSVPTRRALSAGRALPGRDRSLTLSVDFAAPPCRLPADRRLRGSACALTRFTTKPRMYVLRVGLGRDFATPRAPHVRVVACSVTRRVIAWLGCDPERSNRAPDRRALPHRSRQRAVSCVPSRLAPPSPPPFGRSSRESRDAFDRRVPSIRSKRAPNAPVANRSRYELPRFDRCTRRFHDDECASVIGVVRNRVVRQISPERARDESIARDHL